jgi:hypothetical protein
MHWQDLPHHKKTLLALHMICIQPTWDKHVLVQRRYVLLGGTQTQGLQETQKKASSAKKCC